MTLSTNRNADIARESIESALRKDWECLRNLYAEDAVLEGTPEPMRGRDAIVNLWQGCLYDEVPGLQGEITNVIAQGDMVAVEWLVGEDKKSAEVHVCQLRAGKIVANRIYGRAT
tara:strand:- start:455 stop:799 length:345 start_codon:yes stop_codon:yes gene_type:complete